MTRLNLVLESLPPSEAARGVEIVERKGIGHPDTICDALAERFSLALAQFYLARFGTVLHHNVDKALLRGGASRATFGGGEVLEPIDIYLAGRAVVEAGGVRVPVEELAIDGTREWLASHLHALDPLRHVRVHCLVRPGSADLAQLF
jgi:S-adenosylmethionine synthetase